MALPLLVRPVLNGSTCELVSQKNPVPANGGCVVECTIRCTLNALAVMEIKQKLQEELDKNNAPKPDFSARNAEIATDLQALS